MKLKLLTGIAFVAMAAGCSQSAPEPSAESGTPVREEGAIQDVRADLMTADGSLAGEVTMRPGPHGLLFVIEGEGWPEGWHGVHVHASGRCDGPAFESAAGHLNNHEQAMPHGLLNWDGGPDYGDLQNVYAGADGRARAEVYLPDRGLGVHDMGSTEGLSLIVHANRDDHVSQPIGGAGDRIACAVLVPAGGHPASD